MSLNIKNPRVHELAREAARRTGQNQTSVIETALRKLLDDLDKDAREKSHLDLIHSIQEAFVGVDLNTDDLYDEDGLPK